jgi:filamentous hemagglutinin family protein
LLSSLLLSSPLSAAPGGGLIADGTAGTNITLQDQTLAITGGTIQGGNLLHSFREFNVETGQTADFQAASDTNNIISRVTGTNDSWIDGKIQSTTSEANLYLVNPNGIVMGANASLDVNGAFHATTADYVTLADGQRVYADANQGVTLTVAAPESFGFLDADVGKIEITGSQLRVADQQAMSLVGGEITLEADAQLQAPGGQIDLVSVAAVGDIRPTAAGITTTTATNATISLTDSNLRTDGAGGGRISLSGDQVILTDSVLSARTHGTQNGRGIALRADSELHLTRSLVDTRTTHTGDAGAIQVQAPSIVLDMYGATGDVGLRADSLATSLSVSLTLSLTLEHTWLGDLVATLISPAGTELTLFRNIGEDGDHLSGTIFADSAETALADGSAPFTGEFRPQTLFSTLQGEALDGEWQLHLTDNLGGDTGEWQHWSLQILGQTFSATDLPQAIEDYATVTSRLTVAGIGYRVGDVRPGNIPGQAGTIQIQAEKQLQVWHNQPAALLSAQQAGNGTPGDLQVETPFLQVNGAATADSRFHAAAGLGHFVRQNIITDGRWGQPQRPLGPNYQIPADWGTRLSTNLYHSFAAFNLDAWEEVTFSGPAEIQHIIAQVQGPASWIGGTLRSTIAGADLWLINPAGILFGEYAALDLTGALHLSTADQLILADHTRISADTRQQDLVSVAVPEALGFLDADIGKIEIAGSQLRVADQQAMSLVGGEITLEVGAQLQAISGQINLVGVASAGDVQLTPDAIHNTTEQAHISFTDSWIEVNNQIDSTTTGRIRMQAHQLTARNSVLRADNNSAIDAVGNSIELQAQEIDFTDSHISTIVTRRGQGGSIQLRAADQVRITGENSRIDLYTTDQAENSGAGGDLVLQATDIMLADGVQINVETHGTGDSGSVRLVADDGTVKISNNSLIRMATFTEWEDAGKGGDLLIQATDITLADGAKIEADTYGTGDGGSVHLVADGGTVGVSNSTIKITTNSEAEHASNGGDLVIQAAGITLADGANIEANTYGTGDGGSVQLMADGAVGISNSFILMATESEMANAGKGGDLLIQATAITLADNVVITVETYGTGDGGSVRLVADGGVIVTGDSIIKMETNSEAENAGTGGDLVIQAIDITLADDAQINAATYGAGDGGSVRLVADGGVIVTGDSIIKMETNSEAENAGTGGDLVIQATDITLANGAWITATTYDAGAGGSVRLVANNAVGISKSAISMATISTAENTGYGDGSAKPVVGNGGDLLIQATDIMLADGAEIMATTFSTGNGGSVRLMAEDAVGINGSGIFMTTSSEAVNAGKGGDLVIQATDIMLAGGAEINAETAGAGDGGSIRLVADDAVGISGSTIKMATSSEVVNAGKGGDLVIQAADITLAGGAEINAETSGAGAGGSVRLVADNGTVEISNSFIVTATATFSEVENAGQGGDLLIQATDITLLDRAMINAMTIGTGNSGSVRLVADDAVEISDSIVVIEAAFEVVNAGDGGFVQLVAGNGGKLVIQATDITLADDTQISAVTRGIGDGGSVQLVADDGTVEISNNSHIIMATISAAENAGRGGELLIQATDIVLANYATIDAATVGTGQGGSVRLAANQIQLSGQKTWIGSSSHALGTAGAIQIQGHNLVLVDHARIESTSGFTSFWDLNLPSDLSPEDLPPSLPKTGAAGQISIDLTGSLHMRGNSQITTTTAGTGAAGNILIGDHNRPTELWMTEGARITSGSESDVGDAGDAGRLVILTGEQIQMHSESALATESANAGGGGIRVETRDLLHLQNSRITTSVAGGDGRGGDINIDPVFVILENSKIQANAHGGAGGNINLVANYLLRSGSSAIEASSELSTSGEIQVQAVDVDAGSLQVTTQIDPLDVAQWAQVPCHLRRGKISRLVMAGYDAHPTPVDDVLSSLSLYTTLRQSYSPPHATTEPIVPQARLIPPMAPLTVQHSYLLAAAGATVGCTI